MTRLNDAFAAIGGWSYDHRWWVLCLSIGLLAGCLTIAAGARTDASYENYFDPQDDTYVDYLAYRDEFGSDEVAFIVYSAPGAPHGVFDLEVMRRIIALTQTLEDEVPFVYEVRSLANAELMRGVDDDIVIDALADVMPDDQSELLALRDAYLAKPMIVDGLLSRDARHGAIIIEMDRTSTDAIEDIRHDPELGDALENLYPQVSDRFITEILARPEYEGIVFHYTGDVPLNGQLNRIITNDSTRLGLLTTAVIAVVLLIMLRSLPGMLASVLVVQASVIATVAFVVLLGWRLDMGFSGVPTLLTAIGVAHAVHILSEFRTRFVLLGDRREALVQTLYLVATPCFLTSFTTAIGFASLSASPIVFMQHMGIYSAFGVIAAFFLSLTLLMALLSFGPRTPRATVQPTGRGALDRFSVALLDWIAALVVGRRRGVLAVFGLIFVLSVAGIAQITVDSNWLNDFSDESPLKQATLEVDAVMGGVGNLVLLLDGETAESIKEPAVLREIERIQDWADARPLVRKSYSIVDVLKDLNQTFHDNDPAYHRLPESRELVAQYLLLYESAGGAEADEFVSGDRRRAIVDLRLGVSPTSQLDALVTDLEAELARAPLQAATIEITGIGALWIELMNYIVTSQINGFLIAFGVITLVMCLLFRSLPTGFIAMVPNVSPVFLTLGVIGWIDSPLDYNKVMIAAVAMGIAVDDTIHLLTRVRHEFERLGDYAAAIRESMSHVGRALLVTSVALVCGFLVLTQSTLDSQALRGVLLSGTIVVALIADFFLLPALLLTFQPFGPEGARHHVIEESERAAA